MYYTLIGKNDDKFYLLPNITYTVGRKDSDFVILKDESISRKHAELTVTKDQVTIKDVGSRYGTYINEMKLKTGVSIVVKNGNSIKFGMYQSIYRLEGVPIINTTSGIKSENKTRLKNNMNILGGLLVQNWMEQCNYVTVEEMMLTVKVLSAVISGVPIVTVNYWDEYVKCLKDNKPIPDVKEYKPKCSEVVISENVSLEYKEERQSLFKNKVFVFPRNGDKEKMGSLIKLAGGKSISWDANPLNVDEIDNSTLEYVVMLTSNINESMAQNKALADFIKLYIKRGNRTIPLQEIALAIINCSCQKDCNPKFDRKACVFKGSSQQEVRSQAFLALPTQSMDVHSDQFELKTEVIIPQSYDDLDSKIEIVKHSLEDNKETNNKEDLPPVSKRENDSTHNESDCKRVKLDEISPTIQVDRPNTESNGDTIAKQTSGKSLFTFNDTDIAKETFNSIMQNNPFTRKRKAVPDQELNSPNKESRIDDTLSPASSKKVINPFSNLFRSTYTSQKENVNVSKVTSTPKVKPKDKEPAKISNSSEIDFSAISVVDNDLEKSISWITKSSGTPSEKSCITKGDKNIDEDMELFVNSFKDTIIIEIEDMIVHKSVPAMDNSCGSEVVNYKKFKKVQPLRKQKTIVPESKYVSVVCSNNNECEYVQEVREEEHEDDDNMNSEPLQERRVGRQYVF